MLQTYSLRRLLLEPLPTDGGNGGVVNIQAPTPAPIVQPTAPSQPRVHSPKSVGVENPSKALPAESKDFQFKIEDAGLLNDSEGTLMPEIKADGQSNVLSKPTTPLDVANAMLEDKGPKKEEVKPTTQPKEVKAEVTKTPEVADATKQTDSIIPKGPIVPKAKSAPVTQQFDYSAYAPEEAAALKQMSTEARDFTIKLLKEKKELSSQTGGTYLQHPDAYVLDPVFSKLNEDVSYAKREGQHWQSQLIKASNGEKWQPIEKWDSQGNPILGAEQTPSTLAVENIRTWMNKCFNVADQKEGELHQFATGYQSRIKQDTNNIQSERARRFGWVADPKILDSTLTLEDGTEQSVKQVRENIIGLFPTYMRKELGVEVAADLFVAFQIVSEALRTSESTKTVVAQQVKDTARAEPTTSRAPSAGATNGKVINGVKEFSMAGAPI